MKALALVDRFGIDNLAWIDRPSPRPGPGEVLVRLTAASLNRRDIQVVEGQRPLKLPLVPISDGAGVVVATGAGATEFAPGDLVMPCFVQGWLNGPQPPGNALPTLGGPLDGVCTEFGVWPQTGLVRAPAGMTDLEAATLPCAAVTAWNALFEADTIRPGETVLVQGTGGVSLFALQFARLAGARVILVSGNDAKIARAKALGADAAINYRLHRDWGTIARGMTAAGIDHVIEVGGQDTIAQSIDALANGGHISIVGSLSGPAPSLDLDEVNRRSLRVSGIRIGNRDTFQRMCRAIEHHALRPVINSEYPVDNISEALRRLKSREHFGKICVSMNASDNR